MVPPATQSQGVVMVIHDELKSEPCLTIHYTYNEILEGLRCCELSESLQTFCILIRKAVKLPKLLTFLFKKVPFRLKIFFDKDVKICQCIINA